MADSVKKAKLGYEDLHIDTTGAGTTTQTPRSDGTYRTVQKLNATHIPITTTARAKKQASGAAVGTTNVDTTLIQILDDLEDIGQPDGSTLSVTAGVLAVADGGVDTTQLAADAVDGTKIADDSIDSEHYVAASIDNEHLADSAVDTDELAADAVTGAKIADDAVDSEHIAAGAIDNEHLAAGILTGDEAANVANDQTTAALPVLYVIAIAGGAAGNKDITITQKVRVIDVWAQHTGGAGEASDTIRVYNGASAITDAMSWAGADNVIVRAASIDDAASTISASGTLRVTTTDADAGTDVGAGLVYVLAIPVA